MSTHPSSSQRSAFQPLEAPLSVRPLQQSDLPTLLHIQRACYGDGMIETQPVYARRLASPAQCIRLLRLGHQGVAYLAAYYSRQGKVTALHGDFVPSDAPDTLYLHDMAVLPSHAGLGLARQLLDSLRIQARADGLQHAALVSVQGSQSYWERHGFQPQALEDAKARAALHSYGEDAIYMVQSLVA